MSPAIEAALRAMLGPSVGIGMTDPGDPSDDLWPTERDAMARAIPKRRTEFAAGRRAARLGFAQLGLAPTAIPQGRDRAPIWPAGITGSIAHCDTLCVAAVARTDDMALLGIDIEPATPLAEDLHAIICTPPERTWLATQPDPGHAAKWIFSAKEAIYKAQYPATGQVIGFDAVTLRFDDRGGFEVISSLDLPPLSGVTRVVDGMILSACQHQNHTIII